MSDVLDISRKALVHMERFFTDYHSLLQKCHNDILQAIEGLPSEALDWVPGEDMNSINVLLFHTTGSVRYWIGDVAVQESSNRDREAEFKVRGLETDILRKRLADNLDYARTVCEKLTLADLEAVRVLASDGRQTTVAWALLHALEHATLHLGQIQLTRQLWEQKK
jgi:uncharacterized damage-inducible protein DinB